MSVARPAYGQVPLKFSLGGGATLPTADVGDVANTGWHAEGMATLSAVLIPLSVRAEFGYHHMGLDESATPGGDLSLLGGGLNLIWTFPLPSRVRPYLTAGMGVYRVKADVNQVVAPTTLSAPPRAQSGPLLQVGGGSESSSETKLGFNGGGGLNLWLGGGVSMFVEGRYLSVRTSGSRTDIIPLTVGITFRGG